MDSDGHGRISGVVGRMQCNMVKQASAVVTLLKEAVELESLASSRIVQTVKKGVMKSACERDIVRRKKVKSVMS